MQNKMANYDEYEFCDIVAAVKETVTEMIDRFSFESSDEEDTTRTIINVACEVANVKGRTITAILSRPNNIAIFDRLLRGKNLAEVIRSVTEMQEAIKKSVSADKQAVIGSGPASKLDMDKYAKVIINVAERNKDRVTQEAFDELMGHARRFGELLG